MSRPTRSSLKLALAGVTCLLGVLLLSLPACKHEPLIVPDTPIVDNGGGGGGGVIPVDTTPTVYCDPDTVYFQQQVLPLIVSYCASGSNCHSQGHEHPSLYNYSTIRQRVTAGNAANSSFIHYLSSNDPVMPPNGSPDLSAAQIALISQWINQGALNNSCVGGCDTTNVTYNGNLAPLFATFCTGCHSGTSPQGNFNVTTWTSCNTAALNGTLGGDIMNTANHHLMPPAGGAVLSQCSKDRIMNWIQQGAPNN